MKLATQNRPAAEAVEKGGPEIPRVDFKGCRVLGLGVCAGFLLISGTSLVFFVEEFTWGVGLSGCGLSGFALSLAGFKACVERPKSPRSPSYSPNPKTLYTPYPTT